MGSSPIEVDSRSPSLSPSSTKMTLIEEDSDLPIKKIGDLCLAKRPHSISSGSEENEPTKFCKLPIMPGFRSLPVHDMSSSNDSSDDGGDCGLELIKPSNCSSEVKIDDRLPSSSSQVVNQFQSQRIIKKKPSLPKSKAIISKKQQNESHVIVLLDKNLISETEWGTKIIDGLKEENVPYEIEDNDIPFTIQWKRTQSDDKPPQIERQCFLIWSINKVASSVKAGTLVSTFKDLKEERPNLRMYLGIYGKTKKSREQIEMDLMHLQVICRMTVFFLTSPKEVSKYLFGLTKGMNNLPAKLAREKLDMERRWFVRGESKKCVRVDKNFNGFDQLWLRQLAQFNSATLDSAKAVAAIYPTPMALYTAYQGLSTIEEKEMMLQDIIVKRGKTGGKRLGPELSRRISLQYCRDGNAPAKPVQKE